MKPKIENFIVKYPEDFVLTIHTSMGITQWRLFSPYTGKMKSGAIACVIDSKNLIEELFYQIGEAFKQLQTMTPSGEEEK